VTSAKTLDDAIALHEAGKFGEAAAIYRDLLIKDPTNVTLMHLLALIAMQFDQPKMVLSLSEEGLKVEPNLAILHQDRATALRRLGRKEEAVAAINRALAIDPKEAGFYDTLAAIQRDMREYGKAVESLRTALRLNPEDPKYYNNLGICLGRMGANEEALGMLSEYVRRKPEVAEGYNNRANVYKMLRRYREALADYDKSLSINPQGFMAQANKGFTLLILGEYEEGWKLFEDRKPGNMPPEGKRFDIVRRWKGQFDKSATLILYNEQGLGDTVQFSRYVPLVREKVGKVILQVQKPLIPLLQLQWPELTYITEEDPLPDYTLQCQFMSLPSVFHTTTTNIPLAKSYLKADVGKVRAWQEKLPKDGLKRIGLVWAGNPDHMNDHLRSIPLAQFAPLWDVPGLHFFSLQKGSKALEQMACLPASLPFTSLDEAMFNFAETAALLSCLDLLITVDTATLHLAGALGVPTYALLQYDPDWRWMVERPDTPWYDSVRLFRQRTFGDWSGVIAEVRQAIAPKA
jgi:tetratricopeptide (TPR) repeat protein